MGNAKSGALSKEVLEDLKTSTRYSEEELCRWYESFQRQCPDGRISRAEFEKIYGTFFPNSDPQGYARHVFRSFDTNDDGTLDFREYIIALHLTSSGKTHLKLEWAFSLFDVDRNGEVSKGEVLEIITALPPPPPPHFDPPLPLFSPRLFLLLLLLLLAVPVAAMGNAKSGALSKEVLEDLKTSTRYSEEELCRWYESFQRQCPDGRISRAEFEKIYGTFFPNSDPQGYARHVFRSFDTNDDGTLDFREYIIALHLTSSGKTHLKLEWAFSLFDVDRNGEVSKGEVLEIITGEVLEIITVRKFGISGWIWGLG
ncbi:Visinin [Lonchura striata]|uniref:Visinin n=1 Tax=Lonchura striata TaxID=40157 RepID=A0A218U8T8_9PASE|nr:Visinin [Lonchura striata domestica]